MKKISFIFLLFLAFSGTSLTAQNDKYGERHGGTLNLGLGIGGYSGYYGYVGEATPIFHANYEFDITPDFTAAPFATLYTYRGDNYREIVVPVGVKGTFYFDHLFMAGPDWDFYLAGSLGVAIANSIWDDTYYGDRTYWSRPRRLFLDIHAGIEYHLNSQLGLFLDLSNGVSTIGLAIH